MIALEDNYEDIVAKAQSGLGITTAELAERAGLDEDDIRAARKGTFKEEVARKLAGPLKLREEALIERGLQSWRPLDRSLPGLAFFSMSFQHPSWGPMVVNAGLVQDPESERAVVFDAGTDAAPMLAHLREHQLDLVHVLLTHNHPDHILGVRQLLDAYPKASVWLRTGEQHDWAQPFELPRIWEVGALRIEARSTPGHTPAGTTYVVDGLNTTVAAVGDALFAQSVGGAGTQLPNALEAIRSEILSLPEAAILLPGHGPITTVGEELAHNPFF